MTVRGGSLRAGRLAGIAALAAAAGLASGRAGPARADDLSPPPEDCPRGAVGTTQHAGEWCVPTECRTDADCTPPAIRRRVSGFQVWDDTPAQVCRPAALCVVEETYVPGGLRPDVPEPQPRTVARGPCVDGTCPAGGSCREARRCVRAEDRPEARPRPETAASAASSPSDEAQDDDGCAASPPGPATGGGVGALLALLLGLSRRRRLQAGALLAGSRGGCTRRRDRGARPR